MELVAWGLCMRYERTYAYGIHNGWICTMYICTSIKWARPEHIHIWLLAIYIQLIIDFSVDRTGLDIELEKYDEIPSIGETRGAYEFGIIMTIMLIYGDIVF